MNFDKVAGLYTFLEKIAFGNKLQVARIAFLKKLVNSKNILLIGEGRGRLLSELLKNNSNARITVLESSKSMVSAMRKVIEPNSLKRIKFVNSSFQDYASDRKYDAICTCFFWDCFTGNNVKLGVSSICRILVSNGIWINVDFALPPSDCKFRKFFQEFLLKILYGFFQISSGVVTSKITVTKPIAQEVGFKLVECKNFSGPTLSAELYLRS